MNLVKVHGIILLIGAIAFLSLKGQCEDMKNNNKSDALVASISADRNPPAKVAPLSDGYFIYEASANTHGTLIAKNKKTGQEIWKVFLTDYLIQPQLETDVQEVYLTSLAFSSDKKEILAIDEVGTHYQVDIATQKYKIINWPVQVLLNEKKESGNHWNYKVKLKITNNRKSKIQLDGMSVGENQQLSNNLFEVVVDGKKIDYRGMMAKRAPPDKFIELKSGKFYESEMDLSEFYSIPKGSHVVKIRFNHRNHFSPDNFQMSSPWIEEKF